MRTPARRLFRPAALLAAVAVLAACGGNPTRPAPPPAVVAPPPPELKVGLALGGGAAKGFAHIGVIKMLEANGIRVDTVAGTSAGSVVGALYASGMDAFQMQDRAVALDESSIRDVRLFSGGLVQGQALQDYVNAQVGGKAIDALPRPFAAVSTELDTGRRVVFVRGNTGQAVRASSSIPGVFEPVAIRDKRYVDGGVVSPVPVDAARELGADFVIAVDISTKANGSAPSDMLGIVNRSIAIMGQRAGAEELARADVVIRPEVQQIGPADFEQRSAAIMAGERAALAALPVIRARLAEQALQRSNAAQRAATARAEREAAQARADCEARQGTVDRWLRRDACVQ
ncbi:patatin-like phospholipase family protein [Lysobacter sp. SG-8]|uniref:Patatin-like phospholipase family protein n=1 Tax=Marilutibacter penaei TaxID=2759900 RepID=A0A7W3U4C4_9GAMM|nr:patatin-like phospholipase family protein [Lysobacter penaei]MBB1088688.1 patatin-like phospholipase family protein [Lysobacter penaei]